MPLEEVVAGLLAEGTRQARAAARGFPRASPGRATEEFPAITRSSATARRVGWVSACVACVAARAAASTFIFMHHQGSGSNALVFTYTILAGQGQNDTNGISIGANASSAPNVLRATSGSTRSRTWS